MFVGKIKYFYIFIFLFFYIFIPLGSFFIFIPDTKAASCKCELDPENTRRQFSSFECRSDIDDSNDCVRLGERGVGYRRCQFFPASDNCTGIEAGRSEYIPPSVTEPIEFTPQVTVPGSGFEKGKAQRITETTIGDYIKAIYNFIIGIVGILAVVMIMWGGFKWLTAAGNPGVIGNAQATIFNALIGLVLALGSYTLLYIINPNLVRFKSIVPEYIAAQPLLSPTEIIVGCDDCASMAGSIPCKSANNCRANRNLVDALKRLKQDPECGSGWRVTEGYPPTTQHRDRDHGNGRAVDIALSPPITGTLPTPAEQAKIDALYRCLQKHGFQSIANEYQRWYDTTTGNHFHVEWH